MNFRSKNHQAIFNEMSKKIDRQDKVKMSVLYLLTADTKLWNAAKHHISHGNIHLDSIRVKGCTGKTYTLFCCAKDMANGTSHLTIFDLADTELISPKIYGVIETAIRIRRCGVDIQKASKKEVKYDKSDD